MYGMTNFYEELKLDKAQCLYVVEVFQKIADRRNIKLKLTKKK